MPLIGWAQLHWLGLRERARADCHEDTLRGLEQHSKGQERNRPGKLRVCQRNKGSFLQESSNVLCFYVLTEQGTMPKQMPKRGEPDAVYSPRSREGGVGRQGPTMISVPETMTTTKLWVDVGHHTHLPGSPSSLALPEAPQLETNSPRKVHDPPQTMVTSAVAQLHRALITHSSGVC